MTERWERELKKLRSTEPSEDVWDRAHRGPTGDPLPPRRQRIVAGVVAMSVFLAAGIFAWRAFQGSPTTSGVAPEGAVVRLEVVGTGMDAYPRATFTLQDASLDVPGAPFSWTFPGGKTIYDGALPEFTPDDYIPVARGTSLAVTGDAESVDIRVGALNGSGFESAQDLGAAEGSLAMDTEPGRQVVELSASFEDGGRAFYLPIRLVDGRQPPLAGIEVGVAQPPGGGSAAPFATLRFGGIEQRGVNAVLPADGSGPASVVETWTAVPVDTWFVATGEEPPGLRVTFLAPEGARVIKLDEVEGLGLDGLEPGRYVMEISGGWDGTGNDIGYQSLFGIEVVASDVPPPPAPGGEVADVLHVTCTPHTATIDTTQVRPQSDGIHVVIDASGEVATAEIDTGTTPETYFGIGVDPNEDGSRGIPIEPGSWFIGCSARGGSVPIGEFGTSRAPAFRVVDPEGVYVPVDLACGAPTARTFGVTGSDTTADSIAAVPGILPSDSVEPAGYPDGPGFKSGPILTVLRDATAVARIHLPFEANGSWTVTVDACPGSGIGPDAPAGATGPVPNVAVVRCVGDLTEVLTPIVNAQADGLHLLVENEAGSPAVIVSSAWDRAHPYQPTIPADPNEEIVVAAHPGPVVIDCRSRIGDGIDDPFLSHTADDLRLQDPRGFFLPDGLDCDSADEVPLELPRGLNDSAGESYLRVNLSGIRANDVVERAGYLEGRGDEGRWLIVRDGSVIARADYPSLAGVACRGSGITGA